MIATSKTKKAVAKDGTVIKEITGARAERLFNSLLTKAEQSIKEIIKRTNRRKNDTIYYLLIVSDRPTIKINGRDEEVRGLSIDHEGLIAANLLMDNTMYSLERADPFYLENLIAILKAIN